jgi:hypothetical protein
MDQQRTPASFRLRPSSRSARTSLSDTADIASDRLRGRRCVRRGDLRHGLMSPKRLATTRTSDTRDRILVRAGVVLPATVSTRLRSARRAGAGVIPRSSLFGTKQRCSPPRSTFRSTRAVIGPLREVPVERIGYVLPSILLPLWDSEMGKGLIATLRSILAGNEVSLIRSFLQEVIGAEVGSRVDNPPGSGRIRVQFVASQLVGIVMARYILELEPFKSLPVEQIAETIGPNLQRYLTGDLPGLT